MDNDENQDMNEIEELAEQFKRAADMGDFCYLDEPDLEDVIGYFLDNDDWKYSKKAIAMGLKNYPKEPYFRILHVKYFTLRRKFKDAENEINYIELHFPPIPELYVEKIMLAHATNQNIDAIALLKKALKLDEGNPEIHLLCAVEYLDKNNVKQAVNHAKRAIYLDPEIAMDITSVTLDVQTFFKDNKQVSIRFFTALSEEFPLSSNIWSGLGISYLSENDYTHALEAFQNELALDDNDPLVYMNIGESYFGLNEYHKAIDYFHIANERCDIMQFNIQLGRCYFELKEYDKAMHYFRIAYQDTAMHTFVIPDIVRLLLAEDKVGEARTFLLRNFKEAPQELPIMEELLNLLTPEKDHNEMKLLCDIAIKESDDPSEFFDFLVHYCCDNEYFEFGIEICEEHRDLPDISDVIGYHLAALYLLDGQIPKGCEYLKNAIMICDNNLIPSFVMMNDKLMSIPQVADIVDRYQAPTDSN